MTKKLQKKVVKKTETKKTEPSKKSESSKKTDTTKALPKSTVKKTSTTSESSGSGGLGKKHSCYNCNTKFYDLGKEEKICPKCGSDQNTRPTVKVKLTKSAPKLSEFDVVDEDVAVELSNDDDILLEQDSEDDPEPILDEEDTN